MNEKLHNHLRDLLKQGKFQEFNEERPKGAFKLSLPTPAQMDSSLEIKKVDFSNVDFLGEDLNCSQFEDCNFNGASFRDAILDNASLGDNSTFDGADFYHCSLQHVRMYPGELAKANNVKYIIANDTLVAAALAAQNQELLLAQLVAMWEMFGNERPHAAEKIWKHLQRFPEVFK